MSLRTVDVMRTVALVGAALASSPGTAQTPPRPRPPAPPVVPLRADGCPVVPPAEGRHCGAATRCWYEGNNPRLMQCECYTPPLASGQTSTANVWRCLGLAPPEHAS